jgi:HAD superfamily hydrolase (TIGR01549 family)
MILSFSLRPGWGLYPLFCIAEPIGALVTGLKQPSAVLFDLFDTLILIKSGEDFNEKCLLNVYKFLRVNGIDVSYEDFRHTYSDVRRHLYERINVTLEEPHFSVRISETLKRLGYDFDALSPISRGAAEAYSEEFVHHVYLDNDALPVLQSLREDGYKTGIISNFAIPECAHNLLGVYGLRDLLDVVVVSAEVNRRKPSPEIFAFALNSLGIGASHSFFVGDTPDVDIRGAKKVGMKTVLIERRSVETDNPDDKPDFIIRRLIELPAILWDYKLKGNF